MLWSQKFKEKISLCYQKKVGKLPRAKSKTQENLKKNSKIKK